MAPVYPGRRVIRAPARLRIIAGTIAQGEPLFELGATIEENHERGGKTRNSPDESDASSTPHDWTLSHIDAPQRTWPCYPVPSVARATGVPRDSPAVDCHFRWGARYVRLLGTVRTLYTNTLSLSSPFVTGSRAGGWPMDRLTIVKWVSVIAYDSWRDRAGVPLVTAIFNQD